MDFFKKENRKLHGRKTGGFMKKIKNFSWEKCLEGEYASDGLKLTLLVVVYIWFLFITAFC